MRSPLSVKRTHTNHHATNTRRNRGKAVKNARMRRKQWSHALVYSPEITIKRQTSHLNTAPVIKEVSEEERAYRAERKREKKLISKQNDDVLRRLELERKAKEREERRIKREQEKLRQEEIEYLKWQEMQRKKEEKLKREAEERLVAEKKAAAEAKKAAEEAMKAAEAQQAAIKKDKEKLKKQRKPSDNEKVVTKTDNENIASKTTSNVEAPPAEQPKPPVARVDDESDKKKKRKEKESSLPKEVPVNVAPVEATPPPVIANEEEKSSKKKGGKAKKTSESDSGFHNGEQDVAITNDVDDEKEHDKTHEVHGKKNKKNKKNENDNVEVANGHTVFEQSAHVIESSPVSDVPNGGFVQVDVEKKKGRGRKRESSPPSSVAEKETSVEIIQKSDSEHQEQLHETLPTAPKETTDEVSHRDTDGSHDESPLSEPMIVPSDEPSLKKNKQKENKAKTSHSSTDSASLTIDTEPATTKSVSSGAGEPSSQTHIHVSTSSHGVNGVKGDSAQTSPISPPTQFAQNVEKLISHTLSHSPKSTFPKPEIVEIDPNVKLTIDAQLAQLAEKKVEPAQDHKLHITPMPIELHFSRPTTPSSRERVYKLLPKDIIFCSGLLDTHGDNYAAMANDPRNVYKENARSIQRKMRIFKESPHYQTYLRAKEEGRPIEEVVAEEDHM